ncbi:Rne/Rng family ribonuclease [Nesterenkonia flava]|uniref:Rne/Rng family ribonuclease n=1 Tax=Nesterenkonia flava TaxID=469799 RepID=A0ABU1FSW9_9MICC|nr:Rne/Rng family ribonuclease [Nesterenkonia flava]MDR5711322.1 Rne/Rng family ribonuclease [Nesterenkonia flava]
MTETQHSAGASAENSDELTEIFNPFSAPEPGFPGSDATLAPEEVPAPDQPAITVDDPLNVMFQAPDLSTLKPAKPARQTVDDDADDDDDDYFEDQQDEDRDADSSGGGRKNRRKRRRGGRNRNRNEDDGANARGGNGEDQQDTKDGDTKGGSAKKDRTEASESQNENTSEESSKDTAPGSAESPAEADDDGRVIRKKRRRRRGTADMEIEEESEDGHTVTRVRAAREVSENAPAKVTGVKGSTRLEAKRQRRRASRDTGRRRQVITEAEFLARRESVDRKMIVRQRGERIQIGVLEDGVLAEHYVSNTTQDSLIGNVYLGKVQNVLPSMEAAFVDIGRGRNAVLYAGEVDWDAANIGNAPRKIENALKSGDSVLVQVTKDPVGHKGARLTSQVSLPGRYLVFVPGGSMTGISRKLPDTERARLKKILKEQMPENAGVIVRTAAEGASEEELTNDINRLRSLWETIQSQANDKKVLAPELLYAEPDLTIKVVRDVFNEDFSSMEVQGEETWDNIEAYVTYVAPHLLDRLHQWDPEAQREAGKPEDIFAHHRIDEQLNKALDRKVNLPSGGSLVFDRTEAMTVVDVNTGKFTGSGGNLEETVTKNNLEAAEEIVRQLRLRDIGGIIVIDFIDMVLESNRDLVLRRMVECLGRDRTKHQVAEVTSLGLVQMTRKRMGTGLLEVFSTECDHCGGRGIITHPEPVENRPAFTADGDVRQAKSKKRRKKNKGGSESSSNEPDPRELKKLENARQGLAQVAAATKGAGEDDDAPSEASDQASPHQEQDKQEQAGQSRSARRRSGRRSASSSGKVEQNDSPAGNSGSSREPSEKPVLTIAGEAVEVPRGTAQTQEKPAAPEKSISLDQLDEALESRGKAPARSAAPRRRRRAAGSAQGASGQVQQITAASTGDEATFQASAAASTPAEEPKESQEPVMLGVGVTADQISRGS